MKVRMTRLSAGPAGVRFPGQEVEVPEEEALALFEAKAAVPVVPTDVERAVMSPAETRGSPPSIPLTGGEGLPVTAVPGIGRDRAEALAGLGITSLEELAVAHGKFIADRIRGVGVTTAWGWIEEAEIMVEKARAAK